MRTALMLSCLTLSCPVLAAPALAADAVQADFIDGTYVMTADDCSKLQQLSDGGEPSISAVPWSVDKDGFHSWEGSCSFVKVTETTPGTEWRVEAECTDAADESSEAYSFEKKPDGTFLVQLEGEDEPVTYQRCEVKKGQ